MAFGARIEYETINMYNYICIDTYIYVYPYELYTSFVLWLS